MTTIIAIAVAFLFGIAVYKAVRNDNRQLQNNWSQYFDGMRISTKDFYQRLQKELALYEVAGLETREVSLYEGGFFSANRLYLHITWQEFSYDLCVAPFGNSATFVSWWLWRTPPFFEVVIGALPYVGTHLNNIFFPVTYYRVDSANSFMQFAQSKVLKVLDEIVKEQNISALPEYERYPMKQSIHQKGK